MQFPPLPYCRASSEVRDRAGQKPSSIRVLRPSDIDRPLMIMTHTGCVLKTDWLLRARTMITAAAMMNYHSSTNDYHLRECFTSNRFIAITCAPRINGA